MARKLEIFIDELVEIIDSFNIIKAEQIIAIMMKNGVELKAKNLRRNIGLITSEEEEIKTTLKIVTEATKKRCLFGTSSNDRYYFSINKNAINTEFSPKEIKEYYFDLIDVFISLYHKFDISLKDIFPKKNNEIDFYFKKENRIKKIKLIYVLPGEVSYYSDYINNEQSDYKRIVVINGDYIDKYNEFNINRDYNIAAINNKGITLRNTIKEIRKKYEEM